MEVFSYFSNMIFSEEVQGSQISKSSTKLVCFSKEGRQLTKLNMSVGLILRGVVTKIANRFIKQGISINIEYWSSFYNY